MEKFCPACSRVYNDDVAVCEVDGERLVLLNEEPSLVGHVLDGKYTLISKLGEGGMGSVYLAEQATMGREVAIKVLRREFSQNRMAIKRFLREARAASKLAHPNTITVYDFGQSNQGLLYLVMERLSGRPLADILDHEGAMPAARAVHIVSQICDSLSEAHKVGITHRDLKPENIFIEEKVGNSEFVKVLDFGIAKMQGDDATTQATATGMICGTPSYMSPEQAMGKEIDGRSDIYALGILLYEMLTNEKPFDGDTPMEVMLKHINEPAPNIYQRTGIQVPQGVQDAIDALLAKKPELRPNDCQQAKKLLQTALDTPLVGPVLSTNDPQLTKRRRDETNERKQSLENTGLSPAIAVTQRGVTGTERPARKSSAWLWAAVGALVAGGVGTAIALSAGSSEGAAKPSQPVVAEAPVEPTPGPGAGEPAKTAKVEDKAPVAAETPDKAGPDAVQGAQADAKAPEPVRVGEAAGKALEEGAERGTVLAATASVPVAKAKVRISLAGTPEGAQVFEGEALLGTLPLDFEREKDSGTVKLTVKAPGFRPQVVEVGTVADVAPRIELKRPPKAGPGTSNGTKDPGFGTF